MSYRHAPLLWSALSVGCIEADKSGLQQQQEAEVDCSKLDQKQREAEPKCQTLASATSGSRLVRRIVFTDSIGIDDPGESRGEGPIPFDFLPDGAGVAVANPVGDTVGVWDRDALAPGGDEHVSPGLLLTEGGVALGSAVRSTTDSTGQNVVVLGAPVGGVVLVVPADEAGSYGAFEAASAEIATGMGAFGTAVAWGDFDGDGHDDLATTAPEDGTDGAVWVMAGPFNGLVNATADGVRIGGTADLRPDGALESAGDLDGDGADELLVGFPDAGALAVLHGAGAWTTGAADFDSADAQVAGDGDFGRAVAVWSDQNDDGVADLVVGAPGDSSRESGGGTVWLLDGGSVLEGGSLSAQDTVLARVFGEATDAALGTALAAGGDSDGDGTAELIVGAPGAADLDDVETGAVYTVETFDVAGDVEHESWVGIRGHGVSGRADGSQLGTRVRGGVDIDGDGLFEVGAIARGESALEVIYGGALD